ncbi:MAG: hypothetical protein C5B59_06265 [Bacteroidetes bacterium]|nr:MAG: hypothetical protein C5B59_06265 [Bacteroidota bacterium]
MKQFSLTKEQLVEALHARGYESVNVRQITDWRTRDLLPRCDVRGAGRGRSLGREESSWSDGQRIIEQSVWIIELLNLYGGYGYVYVPLWLLGYPVNLDRIREALSGPLERTISSFERDCTSECNMEDVLSDAAYKLAAKLQTEESEIVHVPADAIELMLNVFINPDYDLTDHGAFEAWQLWQEQCQRLQASWSRSSTHIVAADSLDSLLNLASKVKQYLSVAEIKCAVDEASYNDLREVGRDIQLMRRMWSMFTELLSRKMRDDIYLPQDLILRLALGLGRIAIYVDISLRKNGYGPDIDSLLRDAVRKLETAFHEQLDTPETLAAHAG